MASVIMSGGVVRLMRVVVVLALLRCLLGLGMTPATAAMAPTDTSQMPGTSVATTASSAGVPAVPDIDQNGRAPALAPAGQHGGCATADACGQRMSACTAAPVVHPVTGPADVAPADVGPASGVIPGRDAAAPRVGVARPPDLAALCISRV
jgi:hypothetical protein